MARDAIAFHVNDLSAFARSLRKGLGEEGSLPGHLALLNHIARAGGFRNYQHLKALASAGAGLKTEPVDEKRLAQALRSFDAEGRMVRWPAKTGMQGLCLWALWARLPVRQEVTEAEVNAILDRWHLFGDRALLRRSLIDHGQATRSIDGRAYRRTEAAPPAEARALIRALAGRAG
ncbi:DUF2087 domain-containing protein [Defluviimonas sp. SAOS-178_SWC]|uniref:DUF2087 domain-containing protein n=1 Tax=Defluviimonas sp. SAOS-178_SWC TaxID=3121287 RepID=UPI0032219751